MAKLTELQRAQQNERLANEALAQGNIAAAQAYQANISQQLLQSGKQPGVYNVGNRVSTAVNAAVRAADEVRNFVPESTPDPVTGPVTVPTTPAGMPTTVVPEEAFSALQMIENVMRSALGVEGLGTWAVGLWNRGATAKEIVQALRYGTDTSAEGAAARARYLSAFPSMDTFIKDGIFAGEDPELQYIQYRNTLNESAQRFGIGPQLITADKIVSYLTNRVSAAELTNRMMEAASAVSTTPVETMSILQEYYGVQSGDLISFYLDPETTEAELKKRYTSARIGTEAARQNFGINVGMAENLVSRGVSLAEANAGFGQASAQRGFMTGRGETISRNNLVEAQFGQEDAANQVKRIAGSRRAQFEQGGAFTTTQQGVGGLSSASVS